MISCEKAAIICSKTQYREAGFLERIQLRMHLLICKSCAAFSKQNAKLSELCSRAVLRPLSSAEKAELKRHLENRNPNKN